MSKEATPDHPIHELITKRWSPYGYVDKPVAREDLLALFEAARWAASSYNEQPWSYIVGTREQPEQFERVLSCLVEGNQAWARAAPVLALGVISLTFKRNGKPNAAAEHDLGLASGNLCFEATKRGLYLHQMIGILPDKAREVFGIPDGYSAKTGLAIGYRAEPEELPEPLRERDLAPRQRRPIAEFVFGNRWGETSEVVGS